MLFLILRYSSRNRPAIIINERTRYMGITNVMSW
jgi:hypothetical protein